MPDAAYPNDLDNQTAYNYLYDASGNMIKDVKNGITAIFWSPTHKPIQVSKKDGSILKFSYDGNDNRARQMLIRTGLDTLVTYYFRDASGNIQATYQERRGAGGKDSLWLVEQTLYGASRLGVIEQKLLMASKQAIKQVATDSTARLDTTKSFRRLGQIHYELTDHLGNVLAVITDEKLGRDVNHDGTVDFYDARVIEAHDYYAFGMEMPGRGYLDARQALYGDTTKYRFGFNGKELNPSWGNDTYDYGNRMSDQRLGRFFSVDPITAKYPMLTPYQFASNTPIQAIDLDGKEAFILHGTGQTESGVNFPRETINQFLRITGNSKFDNGFRWDAPLTNNRSMRATSADQLLFYIIKTRATMILNGQITDKEPISLIGYSHGGNLGIQEAGLLNKIFNTSVNLITISTPAYETSDRDITLHEGEASEDPSETPGINQHYHIVHESDVVGYLARGNETYLKKSNKTTNYVIPKGGNGDPSGLLFKSHKNLPESNTLTDFLSKLPKMRSAPAPTGIDHPDKR